MDLDELVELGRDNSVSVEFSHAQIASLSDMVRVTMTADTAERGANRQYRAGQEYEP
jgi:hypothetical protein